METPGAGENLLGLHVHRERPRANRKRRAVEQFDQRLGALLQARNRRPKLRALMLVELGRDLRAAGR